MAQAAPDASLDEDGIMASRTCALLSTLLLAACGTTRPDVARWSSEPIFDGDTKLGCCVVGELLEEYPGPEVVAVGETGEVIVIHRDGEGWGHQIAGSMGGEMIQCAVGDVDPERPGLEIVAVGMLEGLEDDGGLGAANLLWRDGDRWGWERIFQDEALIHGVTVADIDPTRPGDEVLLTGFSERAHCLDYGPEGVRVQEAGVLGGAGKNAVAHAGGAAIPCRDGAVVLVRKEDEGWSTQVLDRVEAGQARIASDGERLLVARDDGALALIEGGARQELLREEAKLRGAVLADIDPYVDGLEAATVGYSGNVTVLYLEKGTWTPFVVHTASDSLHHLTAADLVPGGAAELLTCGYDGNVLLLRCQE